MIEVSSTTLPQRAIPKIMTDPRYDPFLKSTSRAIGQRSKKLCDFFAEIPYVNFNLTNGAFYNTIIFKDRSIKIQTTTKYYGSKNSTATGKLADP